MIKNILLFPKVFLVQYISFVSNVTNSPVTTSFVVLVFERRSWILVPLN